MADKFWIGDKLDDLLTMEPEALSEKYSITKKYAETQKRRVTKRIIKRIRRMEKDPNYEPSQEHLEEMERIRELLRDFGEHGLPITEEDADYVKELTVWQMGSTDADGNPQVTTLRGARLAGRSDKEHYADVYEPATPAEITPSRKKPPKRPHKLIMVFGDTQIGYRRIRDTRTDEEVLKPIHSERMLDLIQQFNAEYQPDYTVNLSDTIDLGELSRFDPDSDHFHRTLGPSFQRVHDFYAQLKSDNPKGKSIEVDSNHTARPIKRMLKQMPELYGFTLPNEEYPLLSYYRLASLDDLGVLFISGYGAAEYVHGEEYGKPPVVFKHGTHASATPGSTIRKEAQQNPETHVVRGHGHSYEAMARTGRDGWQYYYMQLGAACLNSGEVPSYHNSVDDFGQPKKNYENWQNQLMMIEDYEDGTYNFNVINVMDGVARYGGREFKSERES